MHEGMGERACADLHISPAGLCVAMQVVEAADAVLRSPYLRLQLLALRTVDMLVSQTPLRRAVLCCDVP